MRDTFNPGVSDEKKLAAPDGAVLAVPGAVEREPRDLRLPISALGQHARDVRAMVLHGDVTPRREALRELRGLILRVQVVRDDQIGCIDFVHLAKVAYRRFEGLARREVIEIADVLTRERLPVHDQRDRALQIRAHRQDR